MRERACREGLENEGFTIQKTGSEFKIQRMGEATEKHFRMLLICIYMSGQVTGCFMIVEIKGGTERTIFFNKCVVSYKLKNYVPLGKDEN